MMMKVESLFVISYPSASVSIADYELAGIGV